MRQALFLILAALTCLAFPSPGAAQSVQTVAGNGVIGFGGDGGPASAAELYSPTWAALDGAGNIYIADTGNNRIRVVNTGTSAIVVAGVTIQPGSIATVAGNGACCFYGDGGLALGAALNYAHSVALDPAGNMYLADMYNNRIRVVNAGTKAITIAGVTIQPSNIATVVGNGIEGFGGDGGPSTAAEINYPTAAVTDQSGNIYIADTGSNRIRLVNTGTIAITVAGVTIQPGNIGTVAGVGACCYSGDGGAAIAAQLYYPHALALDRSGNIYIEDMYNFRLRAVNTGTSPVTIAGLSIRPGNIATIAGNGIQGYSGDGGPATSASLDNAEAVWLDNTGNIYIADTDNNRIRVVNSSGIITTIAGNGTSGYNGDGIPATSAFLNEPLGMSIDAANNIYFADRANQRVRKVLFGTNASLPVLNVTKSHIGNFVQGQQGATFSVTVSNGASAAPTNGVVTIAENLPSGLLAVSMSGTGWVCSNATSCTRNDPLNSSSSYPPITVVVNVANTATSPQVNQVTVSGGGSSSMTTTDSAIIVSTPALINTTAGSPQSANTNSPFTIPLQATVTDANGKSVSGVSVTFTAPASGSSGTFVSGGNVTTATTNSQGVATAANFTANGNAGGPYIVTATTSGTTSEATFSLTNAQYTRPVANFVSTDTITKGSWLGVYGADGYSIANTSENLIPSYASFSLQNGTNYTWSPSPSDVRALANVSGSGRIASCWYNNPTFTFNINFGASPHQFSLYAVDWDSQGRVETVQVLDAATNALLNSQTISNFSGGTFLIWNISGNVKITVALVKGPNAVISGAFFGGANGSVNVNVNPHTISLSANQTQSFSTSVTNQTDQTVTWAITPTIGSINSNTGFYTAPGTISSAQSVTVTATSPEGASGIATVSLTAGAVANPLPVDTTTQGNWNGVYGGDGYSIAQDSQNIPSYATLGFLNQTSYTWIASTSDVRALEKGSGTGRLAACWYSYPTFSFDVNLKDGNSHRIGLYALDWDSKGRVETVQVLDAATNAVLNTQTVSNFGNGIYLMWNVLGHVKITVTLVSGPNAVISGLFFK